jgi:toxin ParE1/3/4
MILRTRQADLEIIGIYVDGAERFGVAQAEAYHEGLTATFGVLSEHPRMARERTELDPPVRLHPYRAHMIVYVEQGGGILVIRILHGHQDWERHLS